MTGRNGLLKYQTLILLVLVMSASNEISLFTKPLNNQKRKPTLTTTPTFVFPVLKNPVLVCNIGL